MKKRIEEFTAVEIENVRWLEVQRNGGQETPAMQKAIDYIKANLATTEPLSVEGIEKVVRQGWADSMNKHYGTDWDPSGMDGNNARGIAEAIQPLTAQGFRVDWSKAPEWATSVDIRWRDDFINYKREQLVHRIPRPAPKMRKRTKKELADAWVDNYEKKYPGNGKDKLIEILSFGATLEQACESDGISTEVPV